MPKNQWGVVLMDLVAFQTWKQAWNFYPIEAVAAAIAYHPRGAEGADWLGSLLNLFISFWDPSLLDGATYVWGRFSYSVHLPIC